MYISKNGNLMNCIYLITATERLKQGLKPYYYIGSKSNCEYVDGLIIGNRGVYYGSSKDKLMKKLIEEKSPLKVEILEIIEGENHKELLEKEREYHIKFDVVSSPEFFNKGIATVSTYSNPNYGSYRNLETGKCVRLLKNDKRVLSGEYLNVNTGMKTYNNGSIEKQFFDAPDGWNLGRMQVTIDAQSGENNYFYGKKHTNESKRKSLESRAKTYSENPEYHKEVLKNQSIAATKRFKGVSISDEHRRKISEGQPKNMTVIKNKDTGECKRVPISDVKNYDPEIWMNSYKLSRLTNLFEPVTCPHCLKISDSGNNSFAQWHFDNCKKNPDKPKKLYEMVTCTVCGKHAENNRHFKNHHMKSCRYGVWMPWSLDNSKNGLLWMEKIYESLGIYFDLLQSIPDIKNVSAKKRMTILNMNFDYSPQERKLFTSIIKRMMDGFNPYDSKSWMKKYMNKDI